jgi:hypothetical protein
MARHETDHEDLMAEATSLRERVEFALPGAAEHVVAGVRDAGDWSLYFGSDPVFHFDARGALRRAFVGGNLYRSQGTTLARLTRTRTEREVQLVRHDLEPDERESFLAAMRERLERMHAGLTNGAARIVQQVPPDADLRPRLLAALAGARQGRLSKAVKKR